MIRSIVISLLAAPSLFAQGLFLTPRPGDDLAKVFKQGAAEIQLEDGPYFVTEALALDGVKDVRVVPQAGAKPVISGGRRITAWENKGGRRWVATLPGEPWAFRELYVDGKRATRARHPNTETFRVEKAGEDRRTSFTFHDGDVRAWAGPERIEFVFYHDWSLSRVKFANIDLETKSVTLRDPVGQTTAAHYAMDHFEKQPRYHLENHPEFLDAPGEWMLDEKAGTVTYLAPDDRDLNTLDVIAPFAPALLHFHGCQNVTFRGITFSHANWELPPGGCAGVQAAFQQVRPKQGVYENKREAKPAAVEITASSGIVFETCRFAGHGASGLWIKNGCADITVADCRFEDVGANGLMIGEASANDANATKKVTVSGCVVERCGKTDYGAVGIWVGLANHVVMKGCELRELPYTGISIGWRWSPGATPCHHNLVENCHIHHIMQKLSDGGGIYTLGQQPGTIFRGNRIHDVPVNIGRAESNGMFLDQGTTDITIEGNTIYSIAKSPLRFHQCGKNLVKGNTLYRGDENIPMVRYNSTPEENITLEDNTAPIGLP